MADSWELTKAAAMGVLMAVHWVGQTVLLTAASSVDSKVVPEAASKVALWELKMAETKETPLVEQRAAEWAHFLVVRWEQMSATHLVK